MGGASSALETRAREAARKGLLYLGESIAMEDGLPRTFLGRPVTRGALRVFPDDIKALSVVGSMGSGKSVGALSVAASFAQTYGPRVVVVDVDCKGDEPGSARALEGLSELHQGLFRYFSVLCEPSHAFPAVEEIASTAEWTSDFAHYVQQVLRVGVGLSHEFFAQQGASLLEDLPAEDSEASSFAKLLAVAADEKNTALYPTPKRWESTEGLRAALKTYASIPQLNHSSFGAGADACVEEHAIRFERLLQGARDGTPAFAYFRLPRFHGLVPLILCAIYRATQKLNTALPQSEHVHVLLICDEVHRALGQDTREIDTLNSLSRSISLVPLWVFQSFSQLAKASGEELARAFCENPVFYFGANDSGYSDNLLLREREVEWWNTDQEGNQTLHKMTALRPGLLAELASGKVLKYAFLARIPRAKGVGAYSLVRCVAPHDLAANAEKGWFKPGELRGALEANRPGIFARRSVGKQTHRSAPRDSGLDDVFDQFSSRGCSYP